MQTIRRPFIRAGLLITSCTFACIDAPPTDHETETQRVYNGVPTFDFPSVVSIEGQFGGNQCTGTLITPEVVVTAGHCLIHQPLSTLIVRFEIPPTTPGAEAESRVFRIVDAAPHPKYMRNRQRFGQDASWVYESAAFDVALVRLQVSEPLPKGAIPMPVVGFEPTVGTPLTLVGYGWGNARGTEGTKRAGTSSITKVFEDVAPEDVTHFPPELPEEWLPRIQQMLDTLASEGFRFDGWFRHEASPSLAQPGDSGGPALVEFERDDGTTAFAIAGVTSNGEGTSWAQHTRLDLQLEDFILPTLEDWEADELEVVDAMVEGSSETGIDASAGSSTDSGSSSSGSGSGTSGGSSAKADNPSSRGSDAAAQGCSVGGRGGPWMLLLLISIHLGARVARRSSSRTPR